MKQYKVIENFNIYDYNPKNRGHKLLRFEVGDTVTESIRRRLKNPQRYLK